MKLFRLSIFLLFILLTSKAVVALSCSVSTSCDNVVVFKMSGTSNAHAELPTQANYGYYVCCSETGLGNSCSGNYAVVLRLSSATNAHVEKNTLSNYPNQVCLSTSSGTIDCNYASDCTTLGSGYVCLASISSDTNAHVGDCNAYTTKVCCRTGDTTPPTTSIDPNGKNWTNSDVSFTLSCSDDVGCLETKYSIIDATASCPSYASLTNTGTSGTVNCTTTCQKAVCYASKDAAGNTESVKRSNVFYIDKVSPSGEVIVIPPSPTSIDEINYTVVGNDFDSGVKEIRIYVNNSLKKSCSSSPCILIDGPYPAGVYEYSIVIYDSAENTHTISGTLTISEGCNNNGRCEVFGPNVGETQESCPSDCNTKSYVYPSFNLKSQEEVNLVISFNDSRWYAGREALLILTIDGKEWTECQVHKKKWNYQIGWPKNYGVWSGYYGGKFVKITSYQGYAKFETNCTLPQNLLPGVHTLEVKPRIY